jgi:RecA-family ATPase
MVEILKSFPRLLTAVGMAAHGPQQVGKTTAVKFLVAALGPGLRWLGTGP